MDHVRPLRSWIAGLLIMLLALVAASRASADRPTFVVATLAAGLTISTIVLVWHSARYGRRRFLAPLELPAPQVNFVGRDEEVDSLADIISSAQGRSIIHIHGPGGIGKTALAIALAHRVASGFPHGQLFTSFTGSALNSTQAVSIGNVLADFVYALEPSGANIPKDVGERLARYRTLSERRRLLVVLDDVPSQFLLEPLLPAGSKCAVIITGRYPMTDMTPDGKCELGPLSDEDAMRLLANIAGYNEPITLQGLVESCGRQPLALRLVGKALAYRPELEISVMLDRAMRVTAGAGTTEPLDAIYGFLNDDERKAFRCLSTIDEAVFPTWMLAAAAGVDEAVARTLATRLANARLLERHTPEPLAESSYVIQDVVQQYAWRRAEIEDPPDVRAARKVRLAEARPKGSTTDAIRRVRGLIFPLMMNGSLAQALQEARSALSLAQDAQDGEAEWAARAIIAELSAELGNVTEAEEMAGRATSAVELSTRARAYRCLGHARRRLYQYDTASHDLKAALRLAEEDGDQSEEIRVLAELAVATAIAGKAPTASSYCERAEKNALTIGRGGRGQLSLVSWARGNVRLYTGDLPAARDSFCQARDIAKTEDQPLRFAYTLYWLGHVEMEAGNYEESHCMASDALEAFTRMRHFYGVARCRQLMGRIAIRTGQAEYSAQMLQEALETFHSCGDPLIEAQALMDLAHSYRRLGQRDQAERLHRSSHDMFIALKNEDGIRRTASDAGLPELAPSSRIRGAIQRTVARERR